MDAYPVNMYSYSAAEQKIAASDKIIIMKIKFLACNK